MDAADVQTLRFCPFELDLRTGELRRDGALVKLQQQPFKVLALLALRAGELVTREELRIEIWGDDTYVDFDQGLNFCIKQIRGALGDQADTPRYVETLPRRGYRFIAPVETEPPPETVRPPAEPAAAATDPAAAADAPEPPVQLAPAAVAAAPARSGIAWRRSFPVVLALLVVLGAFAIGRTSVRPLSPSFQRLTFRRGLVEAARFGSDGQVFYTAAWDGAPLEFFSTEHGAADTRALGLTESRLIAAVGPELMVRRMAGGRRHVLARVPATGGPPRDVAENVNAADWSRDASMMVAVRDGRSGPELEFPLGQVRAGAVQAPVVTWLRLSPRLDRVAFLEHPVAGDDRGAVVTVDDQGRRAMLSQGWASLEGLGWSRDGSEVWFTGTRLGADNALHAVDLQGRERVVYRGPGRLVLHDVGPDGRVLLSRNTVRLEVRLGSERGGDERDQSWFDLPFLADIAADGRGVLFGESGDVGGPRYGIYLRRDGLPPVRLGDGRPLTLSPDGRWVASVAAQPPYQLVLVPTGAGPSRTLPLPGLQEIYHLGWLPDSRSVIMAAREQDRSPRLYHLTLSGGPLRAITPEGVSTRWVVVSPDGLSVVASPRPGPPAFYPVAGGDPRPIPGLERGDLPVQWSHDGHLIVGNGRLPLRLFRIELSSGQREEWKELAPPDAAGVTAVNSAVVTRDGRSYAFGYNRSLSELYLVDGLQ
jgi:DNA-binding winged helix-turn-helix (wHTH) protein